MLCINPAIIVDNPSQNIVPLRSSPYGAIDNPEEPPQQERKCCGRCWKALCSKLGLTITTLIVGILCLITGIFMMYSCNENILDKCNDYLTFQAGETMLGIGLGMTIISVCQLSCH